MLENSIWRQYHDKLDIYTTLCAIYAPWEEMEIEEDAVKLHNTLKAKLTKKEFRLFAMDSADIDDKLIKERFGYDDTELKKAKEKLYKKLKQDKVRLSFRKGTL
ncbi:hypothetical protein MNB_SM-7-1360 [hydrothermal vent metagenome]|uniref:Uncharacterized protein n=1 Tax=hydrothermal vent metagenome TaxID=652676 RepID=A0A1W1BYK6_9ZZZZ